MISDSSGHFPIIVKYDHIRYNISDKTEQKKKKKPGDDRTNEQTHKWINRHSRKNKSI